MNCVVMGGSGTRRTGVMSIIAPKNQRGFTLIELLAVMAIVAVLAGIVAVAVGGTGETSRDTQAQQDATTVETAAADFFSDQEGAEVLRPLSATVLDQGPFKQIKSSKWPEQYISIAYGNVFPKTTDTTVSSVTFLSDTNTVSSLTFEQLLTRYNAIDIDILFDSGFLSTIPDSGAQLTDDTYSNYLWLLQKTTASGGSSEDAARQIAVFKLVSIEKNEFDNLVDLTYIQLVGESTEATAVVNNPPEADDPIVFNTGHGTSVNITLTDFVSDADGDDLTFELDSGPNDGFLTPLPLAISVTYTPDQFFSGPDSFTFFASDDEVTITATVTINVGPPPTLLVDDDGTQCPTAGYTTIGGALVDATPGTTIEVCSGSYNEDLTISTARVSLIGQSGATLDGTSQGPNIDGITLAANGVIVQGLAINNYSRSAVHANGVTGAKLVGLDILNVGHHAIDILNSSLLRIDGVTIDVGSGAPPLTDAIRLESVSGFVVTQANVLSGFVGVNFACDLCDGTEAPTNGVVKDSTFSNNFNGVLVANSTNASVRNNVIKDGDPSLIFAAFGVNAPSKGINIDFQPTSGTEISANEISGHGIGIRAQLAPHVGHPVGLHPIAEDFHSDLEIIGNNIHNNTSDGMFLDNTINSLISDNQVLFNNGRGIALELNSTGNTISGNLVAGHTVDLFHDGTSTPNTWSDNTFGTSSGADIGS